MHDLGKTVLGELRRNGFTGKVVSADRVKELKAEIDGKRRQGSFDEDFSREWIDRFVFDPPERPANVRSVIVTAAPHPRFRVTFHWGGRALQFFIPPTYLHYTDEAVADLLSEMLRGHGFQVAQAVIPVKLLLVRSGLGAYGRNNISYIKGMGSYYRLRAFYSDLPCDDDVWQELKMLDECQKCTACVRACPTGAISSDRFLLHAERCIPFFNERRVDFPEWMDPSWHNCLVGCMICQDVCPVDKPFKDSVEDRANFSEEETDSILDGVPFEDHSRETQNKLEAIEWKEDLDILARNLSLLLV